ncbi:hypothetical protein KIPB_005965, partial [Kipferlia bialata]
SHQIFGLDVQKIVTVVEWVTTRVKRVRKQMGDMNKRTTEAYFQSSFDPDKAVQGGILPKSYRLQAAADLESEHKRRKKRARKAMKQQDEEEESEEEVSVIGEMALAVLENAERERETVSRSSALSMARKGAHKDYAALEEAMSYSGVSTAVVPLSDDPERRERLSSELYRCRGEVERLTAMVQPLKDSVKQAQAETQAHKKSIPARRRDIAAFGEHLKAAPAQEQQMLRGLLDSLHKSRQASERAVTVTQTAQVKVAELKARCVTLATAPVPEEVQLIEAQAAPALPPKIQSAVNRIRHLETQIEGFCTPAELGQIQAKFREISCMQASMMLAAQTVHMRYNADIDRLKTIETESALLEAVISVLKKKGNRKKVLKSIGEAHRHGEINLARCQNSIRESSSKAQALERSVAQETQEEQRYHRLIAQVESLLRQRSDGETATTRDTEAGGEGDTEWLNEYSDEFSGWEEEEERERERQRDREAEEEAEAEAETEADTEREPSSVDEGEVPSMAPIPETEKETEGEGEWTEALDADRESVLAELGLGVSDPFHTESPSVSVLDTDMVSPLDIMGATPPQKEESESEDFGSEDSDSIEAPVDATPVEAEAEAEVPEVVEEAEVETEVETKSPATILEEVVEAEPEPTAEAVPVPEAVPETEAPTEPEVEAEAEAPAEDDLLADVGLDDMDLEGDLEGMDDIDLDGMDLDGLDDVELDVVEADVATEPAAPLPVAEASPNDETDTLLADVDDLLADMDM